jgi:peptidoglycan/LPS O-acetylase OafA/YrhL
VRLNYFDYFRAVSIFLIVAGHSYTVWDINTVPAELLANIITGGTSLFVFISGFFFHYIFYQKFEYKNFLIKKVFNVLIPFILLSTIAFCIIVIYLDHPHSQLTSESNELWDQIVLYFKYLWTGRVLTAYWYIPFVIIIFALSPVFNKYIELQKKSQISIFLILLFVSMVVQRPTSGLSPMHSVIYFTPIYLLGIMFSINNKVLLNFIKNKSIILGICVISLSLLQIKVIGWHGNFEKDNIFSYNGLDIIIIQKIFLIFFIISLFHKIDNRHILLLKYIASISFPIYFIHPWVLFFMQYYLINNYVLFLPGIIIFAINVFVAFFGSIIIANIIKLILNKRSRYLIGW